MKSFNYSRLTGAYVFIIACIIPLFFLPFSNSDAFRLPKFALWLAALFVTLILIQIEKIKRKELLKEPLKKEHLRIYILFGANALIWAVSTWFSVERFTSMTGYPLYNGFLQLLMSMLTFVLITDYFQFEWSYIKYILIAYCLISIYSILQFYGVDPFTEYYGANVQRYVGQAFATIGNQNQVSGSLSVVFVVVSFLYILGDKVRRETVLILAGSLILFAGDIAANTRGGWLAIAFVYLIMAPYVILHRIYLKRYLTVCLGCVLIAAVMHYSSGGVTGNRIISVFEEAGRIAAGDLNPEFGSKRIEIWLNSIDIVKQYWLIGSGPDTFYLVYNNLRPEAGVAAGDRNIFLSPHNESLRLLITTGIFSLAAYWAIVISVMKKGTEKIKDDKLILPLLLGLIAYLIKGMLNASAITDMILFWVLLALIYRYEPTEKVNETP